MLSHLFDVSAVVVFNKEIISIFKLKTKTYAPLTVISCFVCTVALFMLHTFNVSTPHATAYVKHCVAWN